MYEFAQLTNPLKAIAYQSFTFPRYRPLLLNCARQDSIIAIAATREHEPVGLILAERDHDQTAQIRSVFVSVSDRHQGIATQLFKLLEQKLIACGNCRFEIIYTTNATTAYLNRILQKLNWESPQPRRLMCEGSYQAMAGNKWVSDRYPLPPGFEVFSWVELRPEERVVLANSEMSSWIPEDLHPFKYEPNLEPISSVGMRVENQVIGWLLNHLVSADTLRCSCSYIRPNLQKLGRIVVLYAEAIKRAQVLQGLKTIIWSVEVSYPAMVRFSQNNIAGLSITSESFSATKVI